MWRDMDAIRARQKIEFTHNGNQVLKPLEMKVIATSPTQTLESEAKIFVSDRALHEAPPEVLAQQNECRNQN